jgi:hypothetical protein
VDWEGAKRDGVDRHFSATRLNSLAAKFIWGLVLQGGLERVCDNRIAQRYVQSTNMSNDHRLQPVMCTQGYGFRLGKAGCALLFKIFFLSWFRNYFGIPPMIVL